MEVLSRCHVQVMGPADAPPLVFAHGFGCDQAMWRLVAPGLAEDHRVVLFDLVGSGSSDLDAYDPPRYADLAAHAADVLEICHALDLRDVTVVGHSVSAMIAVLAQLAEPDLFRALVLLGPSARYLDDEGYTGGFSESDIADLLELMASNHLGWQQPLSGMVMAGADPAQREELEASFCRTRPDIAHHFARTTFLSDNRADLARVSVPTLLVQLTHDLIAPLPAAEFVRDTIPDATMVLIEGHGHCPHLSAPEATSAAIREFLSR